MSKVEIEFEDSKDFKSQINANIIPDGIFFTGYIVRAVGPIGSGLFFKGHNEIVSMTWPNFVWSIFDNSSLDVSYYTPVDVKIIVKNKEKE